MKIWKQDDFKEGRRDKFQMKTKIDWQSETYYGSMEERFYVHFYNEFESEY